jgi:oligoribonuclease NrnB/cAMP/cGMP phosphodiesterase (DHH superfamily)
MRPLIIHHGDCPDGFGAAWWLGKAIEVDHDVVAAKYTDPADVEACADRHVYIVDFCYPAEELDEIAGVCRTLTVLDHHQTAETWLTESKLTVFSDVHHLCDVNELGGDKAMAVLDRERSGVGLVSTFVRRWRGWDAPEFLTHIQDRDLWRFDNVDTPAVFAAVTSRPYTVDAWDEMAAMTTESLVEVWCAASPYAIGSDVAGELAKRDPELFAAYFVQYGDRRRFGLRSTPAGMDVAALAETCGGGGHRHASGFERPTVTREVVLPRSNGEAL